MDLLSSFAEASVAGQSGSTKLLSPPSSSIKFLVLEEGKVQPFHNACPDRAQEIQDICDQARSINVFWVENPVINPGDSLYQAINEHQKKWINKNDST